jgi:hypothetical protein
MIGSHLQYRWASDYCQLPGVMYFLVSSRQLTHLCRNGILEMWTAGFTEDEEGRTMTRRFGVITEDHDGATHSGGIYTHQALAERAAAAVRPATRCNRAKEEL